MSEIEDLTQEIKRLRRGWGLQVIDPSRVGGQLRRVCQLSIGDDSVTLRERVAGNIEKCLAALPDEPRLTLTVGLCLHPDVRLRQFEDRIEWLSRHFDVSTRTTLRRVDEATAMLAAEMWRRYRTPGPDDGWYVESLRTLLVLDGARPEALERRIIVATRDGLDEIATSVSVPRRHGDTGSDHGLLVDVLQGGTIESREHPYESVFRQVVRLPVALNSGDKHEYLMRRLLPPGQPMAPHYVQVPHRRIDHFELRVRFEMKAPLPTVWRVTAVPTAVIYEPGPSSDVLKPDASGEVCVEFQGLMQGLGYGVCWSDPGAEHTTQDVRA